MKTTPRMGHAEFYDGRFLAGAGFSSFFAKKEGV
jgi:hypothetical protein